MRGCNARACTRCASGGRRSLATTAAPPSLRPLRPADGQAQISCAWGFTTSGGAKGVGESTTSAVVISLVAVFVLDFVLSFVFFQGQGDALKQLKG